jgi:hypothetical protein
VAAVILFLLVSALSLLAEPLEQARAGQPQVSSTCDPAATEHPTPTLQQASPTPSDGTGSLTVHVRLGGRGGVARAGGEPGGLTDIGPAVGAVVRVEASGTSEVVFQATAGADGRVQADLPPGAYWVFVPWSAEAPGLPGAQPAGMNLPDGRPVSAWTETTVPTGRAAEATLIIAIPLA